MINLLFDLIPFCVTVLTIIVLYNVNIKYQFNRLAKYYDEKCSQFPWLKDWFTKNIDPKIYRSKADVFNSVLIMILVLFGVGLITSAIVKFIPHLLITKNYVITIVQYVVMFTAGQIIARKFIKDPKISGEHNHGGTIECPSCGCPHS